MVNFKSDWVEHNPHDLLEQANAIVESQGQPNVAELEDIKSMLGKWYEAVSGESQPSIDIPKPTIAVGDDLIYTKSALLELKDTVENYIDHSKMEL